MLLALLAAMTVWGPAPRCWGAGGNPRVELLTMGAGEPIFARFGHAALLVVDGATAEVYNFGYTDFNSDRLVWDFLRGQATFWAVTLSLRRTVTDYVRRDRSLYRQQLRLTPQQHRKLAEHLRTVVRGPSSRYRYHHYFDNCATRLRDAIDFAVDGQVRRQLQGRPAGLTLRRLTREGFSDSLYLLLATDYLLAHGMDTEIDWWQAGFLPDLLRDGLQRVEVNGVPLASAPETLYRRRSPLPHGNPLGAAWMLGGLAALLTLCGALALLAARRRRLRTAGLLLIPVVCILGLLGVLPWAGALVVSLAEIRFNELALLLWPTDLALLAACIRLLRRRDPAGPLLRAYLTVRLALVSLVAIAHLFGLLHQHPLVWLALAGLPLGLIFAVFRAGTGVVARLSVDRGSLLDPRQSCGP